MAEAGLFTSTTASPALTATNSSPAANSVGALGRATGAGNVARTGVMGSGTGTNGVGVQGNGAKYGVYSNGPLGVAAGKKLVCAACITTTAYANRITVPFNLAAGASSAAIMIPGNVPVNVTGAVLTFNFRGVASATLLRIPDQFVEWTGLESTSTGGSAITDGYASTTGTHIVSIDYDHVVDIQVNNANSIRVHNGDSAARSGIVVITW
jgi:hypothetical protein